MLAGLVCLVAIACASDGDSEQDEPIPRASPVETVPVTHITDEEAETCIGELLTHL